MDESSNVMVEALTSGFRVEDAGVPGEPAEHILGS